MLLDRLGLLDGVAQIETIRFVADSKGDDRAVSHPRVQTPDFELIVGQRLGADLQRLQTVVKREIPLMRSATQFRPVPFHGLEMVRTQEQSFVPVDR
jgi:hypothetical protein